MGVISFTAVVTRGGLVGHASQPHYTHHQPTHLRGKKQQQLQQKELTQFKPLVLNPTPTQHLAKIRSNTEKKKKE